MLTSEQVRAARALLRIEQRELAERAGVSPETIKRIERTPGPIAAHSATVDKVVDPSIDALVRSPEQASAFPMKI